MATPEPEKCYQISEDGSLCGHLRSSLDPEKCVGCGTIKSNRIPVDKINCPFENSKTHTLCGQDLDFEDFEDGVGMCDECYSDIPADIWLQDKTKCDANDKPWKCFTIKQDGTLCLNENKPKKSGKIPKACSKCRVPRGREKIQSIKCPFKKEDQSVCGASLTFKDDQSICSNCHALIPVDIWYQGNVQQKPTITEILATPEEPEMYQEKKEVEIKIDETHFAHIAERPVPDLEDSNRKCVLRIHLSAYILHTDKYQVYLRFQSTSLKTKYENGCLMDTSRCRNPKWQELRSTLYLDQGDVNKLKSKQIQYNYQIFNSHGNRTTDEYFDNINSVVVRDIFLTQTEGDIHRHDGAVYKKKPQETFYELTREVLMMSVPHWEYNMDDPCQNYLHKLGDVIKGAKHHFRNTGYQLEEVINDVLKHAIKEHMHMVKNGKVTICMQMHALSVIYICDKWQLLLEDMSEQILVAGLKFDPNSIDEDLNHILNKELPDMKQSITGSLVNFIGKYKHRLRYQCIWIVPYIHLLRIETEHAIDMYPAVPYALSKDYSKLSCWGLQGLHFLTEACKVVNKENGVQEIVAGLKPLFRIDMLLERSIVYCFGTKYLNKLIPHISADCCLLFIWKNLKQKETMASVNMADAIDKTSEMLHCVLEEDKNNYFIASQKRMKFCVYLCYDIFKMLIQRKNNDRNYKVESSVAKAWLKLLCHRKLSENTNETFINDQCKLCLESLLSWIMNICSPKSNTYLLINQTFSVFHINFHELLMLCTGIMKFEWPEPESKTYFTQSSTTLLRAGFWELNGDFVIQFFLQKRQHGCPVSIEIENCLTQHVLGLVDDKASKGNMHKLNLENGEQQKVDDILRKLCANMLHAWPTNRENEEDILCHVLTWPAFISYVNLAEAKISSIPLTTIREITEAGLNVYFNGVSKILSGKVSKRTIDMFTGNLAPAVELLTVAGISENRKKDQMSTVDLRSACEFRRKQIDTIEEVTNKVLAFCTILKTIDAPCIKELQTTCMSTEAMINLPEACSDEFQKNSEVDRDTIYRRVLFVEDPIVKCIHNADIWKDSKVFLYKLKEYITQNENETFQTQKQFYDQFWHPLEHVFLEYCEQLYNGTILIGDLIKIEGIGGIDQDLRHDMGFIQSSQQDAIMERLQAVNTIRRIRYEHEMIEVFDQLRKVYHLQGKFIAQMDNSENATLNSTLENYGETKINMQLTPARLKVIKAFIDSEPLITWLREYVKDTEAKSVVSLAMITAATQGPMEIQKVKCFENAINGYKHLIYMMEDHFGFAECFGLCEEVWKLENSNERLPEDLMDSMNNMEWIKTITAHGSVEVDALKLVELINMRGVFRITVKDISSRSLEDVIDLTFEDVANEENPNDLDLNKLRDLQSKLMLIAGRDDRTNTDINRFVQLLEGVTTLGTCLVHILEGGSLLFQHWSCQFSCNPKEEVQAIVQFGHSKPLIGKSKQDVSLQISGITSFLEECSKQWSVYLDDQRQKHLCLNYFTIHQIVILQRELAKLSKSAEEMDSLTVDPKVFPLLKTIYSDLSKAHVLKAIQEASENIVRTNILTEKAPENLPNVSEEKRMFLEQVQDAGFSLRLAIRALRDLGYADIESAIMWCMEHEEEDDDDAFEPESTLDEASEKIFRELQETERTLLDQLQQLWVNVTQMFSRSMTDFLSLEHIGCVLQNISGRQTKLNRRLPSFFTAGKPNLVICDEAQMLAGMLTVYSSDQNENGPLPLDDEVLICTDNTTIEEVDIWWRRAVNDRMGKLYCLYGVQNLGHSVGQKLEENFDSHTHDEDYNDYKMFVMCSSEEETKAELVTALHRHKVSIPKICKINDLRTYVSHKFKSASSIIDPDGVNVRVATSRGAGIGKTHYVKRLAQNLQGPMRMEVISFQSSIANIQEATGRLIELITDPADIFPTFFHIDIGQNVRQNIDIFLFNLLILGCIKHMSGFVWRKRPEDYYAIEILATEHTKQTTIMLQSIIEVMPKTECFSPNDSIQYFENEGFDKMSQGVDQTADMAVLKEDLFQRPYHYLSELHQLETPDSAPLSILFGDIHRTRDQRTRNLKKYVRNQNETEGTEIQHDNVIGLLQCLKRECGIPNASWAEVNNFVSFLNIQLMNAEKSPFCDAFDGFMAFVVKFIIQMSKDFSTRSVVISEETGSDIEADTDPLDEYQMKRNWESSPHPYIFFNEDNISMTFLGFYIDEAGNLIDKNNQAILEPLIISQGLKRLLKKNEVDLSEDFESKSRKEQLEKLYRVLGVEDIDHDPDPTYELTSDNVKKILAVYMRFRCGIPVIIMGETGCGKTRLVRFLCDLQKPTKQKHQRKDITNMVLLKVHGGTTGNEIKQAVVEANDLAHANNAGRKKKIFTVLFFDEANTTESIGIIKEFLCDQSKCQTLQCDPFLVIVAACNPYRRHTPSTIAHLEQAGLGYHVKTEKVSDKMGIVPMRHLVYRVQPLPKSLLPFIWDFGTLNSEVEKLYIQQMLEKLIKAQQDKHSSRGFVTLLGENSITISGILSVSQDFMKSQEFECSFVSLRDVERVLKVMMWFSENIENNKEDCDQIDVLCTSLVLALGVCYHACLGYKARKTYREKIAKSFIGALELPHGPNTISEKIERYQDAFLHEMKISDDIARNLALKENVFMMAVCIQLCIPLFIVGKPGSSKTLAKSVVDRAMIGANSQSTLLRKKKKVPTATLR